MSYGIDTNFTNEIDGIDGFPDPTICGETFALGGSILYRRFFTDTTWHSVYQAYEGGFSTLKARERFAYVYAGGSEGFAGIMLIRSSNKGDYWEHLYPGIPVTSVDFWSVEEHKIIVTDGFGVRISMNDGLDWSKIYTTDSLYIKSLSFTNEGERIVIATNTKYYDLPRTYLFISDDDGQSWEKITPPINDIIVNMDIGNDEDIYLATIMSGVYKVTLPDVKVDEHSNDNNVNGFKLYQNYPNPFNPSTTIKYSIPIVERDLSRLKNSELKFALQNVTLKVYDILGRVVTTLVNEQQSPGEYEVTFNPVS
ncbi:MAG: hypothetical protein ABFS12_12730 [Bacteroidota bacterium]